MKKNLYPNIFVVIPSDGVSETRRTEIKTPVYTTTKTSAAKKHKEHTEPAENCFYCQKTNGNLSLEQENQVIEKINKLVKENKEKKNV